MSAPGRADAELNFAVYLLGDPESERDEELLVSPVLSE